MALRPTDIRWMKYYAKIENRDNAIVGLLESGEPQKTIAHRFGLSVSAVSAIGVRHGISRRSDAWKKRG